ncbi:MAG: S8 family peptidase [Saprospiraceae bacterium]|nr:S8 family peptidase [Saprospiraceae bacterium]
MNFRQGELIVLLKPGSSLLSLESRFKFINTENNLIESEFLNQELNIGLLYFDFTEINEIQLIKWLNSQSEVLLVQKNHLLVNRNIPNDTYFSKQWHHLNDGTEGGIAGADFRTTLAWDLTTGGVTEYGDTIVVCVIDGGIESTHGDLRANFWFNRLEIPNNQIDDDQNGYVDDYRGWNADQLNDQFTPNNHGTAVAGIIGATGNNRVGVCGVNWNTKILFVQGGGDEASAIRAYSYPIKLRKDYNRTNGKKGAFVVATNSSWGYDRGKPEDAPIWCAMYDSLGSVGILNVGSTTNLDLNVDIEGDLPTNCESEFLIGVTNINWNDKKEMRSGFGPKSIELGAYGESIFTTVFPNTFGIFNGTSAAAPQVAGTIGLLYSLPCNNLNNISRSNPAQAALMVKSYLLQQVRKLNALNGLVQTSGVLNIFDAMMAIHPLEFFVDKNEIIFLTKDKLFTKTKLQFRKQGDTNWIEYDIVENKNLIINSLEKCTIYEYRLQGACSRYQNSFSRINLVQTEGCCLAPKRIEVVESGFDNVVISFKEIDQSSNFYYYLNEFGSTDIDTFEIIDFTDPIFTIKGLKRCSRYELQVAIICSGKLSNLTDKLIIETSGCDQCNDMDYCVRDRPAGDFEWIEAIVLKDKYFISGNNAGYGDFVGVDNGFVLNKSQVQNLEIFPGYSLDSSLLYMAAWIDFNHNSKFENSENVLPESFQSNTHSKFTFNVPVSARLGLTRMRLVVKFGENGLPAPTPCFNGVEFGEYEDYCIWIVDNNCPAPVSASVFSKTITSCNLLINKTNSNDILSYIYRKLPYGEWKEGMSFDDHINLIKLDSCSQFEIRITNACPDYSSHYLSYHFNTIMAECSVGNRDPKLKFFLFPNPCEDFIYVQSDFLLHRIVIYSLDGRIVKNEEMKSPSNKIPMDFGPGIYFVECINDKTERIVIKVIKK